MTINEYQELALRADNMREGDRGQRLMNGVMGLNGEAGEVIDIFKKAMFQGHDLDSYHVALELGDVAWYLALCADAIGYPLEAIFQMNIDKLKARYPVEFNSNLSKNRAENDI